MKRRSGLGRGLDALLPQQDETDHQGLERVAIDAVDPNPRQPRDRFDERELEELTRSIQELGLLQPLLVRRAGDRFELIAGERRLRASRKAGLSDVPVMIVETDERGSLERALVENLHRSDLNPIEEATAYKGLIEEGGLTQEALAERLGRNRVTITNALRLLDLPPPIQSLLIDGKLTAGHGKALLALDRNPFQERLAKRAAGEQLSVRETEDLVRRYQSMSGSPGTGRGASPRPPEASEAQRALADRLQTRVRVDVGKRKGKITVDFASLDELDRVVDIMLGRAPGGASQVAGPDR